MVKLINVINKNMKKYKFCIALIFLVFSCNKDKPKMTIGRVDNQEIPQEGFITQEVLSPKKSISVDQVLESVYIENINDTIYWETQNVNFLTSKTNKKEELYTTILDKKEIFYNGKKTCIALCKTYYKEIKGRYVYPFIDLRIFNKESKEILFSKVIARTGENGTTPKFKRFTCDKLTYGVAIYMYNNYSGEFTTDISFWGVLGVNIEKLLVLEKIYHDTSMMVNDKSSNRYIIKKSKIEFNNCKMIHFIDVTDKTGNSKMTDYYYYSENEKKLLKK